MTNAQTAGPGDFEYEYGGTDASDATGDVARKVVAAALPDVPFDGWTDRTLARAIKEAEVDPGLSRLIFPRGGVDLALAFHRQNDVDLGVRLGDADFEALRFRDRVARAVEWRLEMIQPHREAVRRAAALFALPLYGADGARAIWQTADTIWVALGDTSDDLNWYTKRATLSGVYSASLVYWLGDDSPDMADTRAFIQRRIDDVMQFEKVKSAVTNNPIGRVLMAAPNEILNRVRPKQTPPDDLPGRWD